MTPPPAAVVREKKLLEKIKLYEVLLTTGQVLLWDSPVAFLKTLSGAE